MLFNSIGFFLFFGVVLGLHSLPLPWKAKKLNLVVASSAFYAAWNPGFVLLLWISIVVDWTLAKRMVRLGPTGRRGLLLVSLSTNLGILCFFKYGDFISANVGLVGRQLGFNINPGPVGLILPVGISFYTFETLSYTIDVYRGDRPWKSFLDFAVFLTFFPHLVAGPIVRPDDFLPQCETERRANRAQVGWGLSLLMFGLFEKVVLADGVLAPVADLVFTQSAAVGAADAWCGAVAFAGQIFCDFAGYSLCAIGVALCFGFQLPDNFNCPYAALGFSDFWTRWHISLSTWLRDYLYISLGGNRVGKARTYVNLIVTMLLGGLWHGAAWTFVAWGGLHGLYLIGEQILQPFLSSSRASKSCVGRLVGLFVTFSLTTLAWVFFRAPTFTIAFDVLTGMAGRHQAAVLGLLGVRNEVAVAITIAVMLAFQWHLRDRSLGTFVRRVPATARAIFLAAMAILVLTESGVDRAFIYFQF
jgi:alginate O-acetyltransferase complex protein AlgI